MEQSYKIKQDIKVEIQRLNIQKIEIEKASWLPLDKELELLDSIDTAIATLLSAYVYINTGRTKIEDDEAQALLESIL